jgi:hypothetical protein
MKSTLSFLCALFVIQFSGIAQQNKSSADGKKFLIQTEVDQIVYYNTNGKAAEKNKSLNVSIYSRFLYDEDHTDSLTKVLPLYYENKRVLTDTSIIRGILQAMPNDTCATIPVSRCPSKFRDIILFYNKGKLVFTLKVCLECDATISMPYKYQSKCLANNMVNVLVNILGYDMFGERRW